MSVRARDVIAIRAGRRNPLSPPLRMQRGNRLTALRTHRDRRLQAERGTSFRRKVLAIVRAVPRGHVVTYGQVALLAGRPHAAREVGWIAHAGGEVIPWQRVVNRFGGLARGYTGGVAGHRRALRRDGVRIGPGSHVDLRHYLWWPDARTRRRLGLG